VHRAIDESQAEIVRRIFAMAAEGKGLKIAKTLNAEGVPDGICLLVGQVLRFPARREKLT
jgi:Recombinase